MIPVFFYEILKNWLNKHHESISFTGSVFFILQKVENDFGRVGYELGKVLIDSIDCAHGVSAHIGVAVFQAGSNRFHERLQQFRLF